MKGIHNVGKFHVGDCLTAQEAAQIIYPGDVSGNIALLTQSAAEGIKYTKHRQTQGNVDLPRIPELP